MRNCWLFFAVVCLAASASSAAAPASTSNPGPSLPATSIHAVVETLAEDLDQAYLSPETGRRYAAMLREHMKRGDYDSLTDPKNLAAQLTSDLNALHRDNHLRVTVKAPGNSHEPGSRPRFPWKPIEEQRWLASGIAYIRFNVFPSDPATVQAVDAFMRSHASARVIIFDNRTHHGGGLAEINDIFSYLYPRQTNLLAMDTREAADEGGKDDPQARERLVKGPSGVVRRIHYVVPSKSERRLFRARVFVLTSGATGSAAEHMTFALKGSHRAVIIGEPTAGANHFGGTIDLDDHFQVFIPVGRSFDPATGNDWEATGVEPDISVSASDALRVALMRAGLPAANAASIASQVKPQGSMVRKLPRTGE